jgi:diphosphomevalonate decarboxylase
MPAYKSTAIAMSNIALIKYWGNTNEVLRLPSNPSISFNLRDLFTTTTVEFDPTLRRNEVMIDEELATGAPYNRVVQHLDLIHKNQPAPDQPPYARVISHNNFPMGAGIASSASAFAALTIATCAALQLNKSEAELSALARQGSGSASRSVPGGFVAWRSDHAYSIAPAEHWALVDVIGVVSTGHKKTGSTEGHALAPTSPLQLARIADTQRRFDLCQKAIHQRDFDLLANVIEQDALMMHGVMMTSNPPLIYWLPASIAIMHTVQDLRAHGIPVAFTIDAGPNIHCICEKAAVSQVTNALSSIAGVNTVLTSAIGGAAHIIGA